MLKLCSTHAKKTGADFSIEMARSVRAAMENWRGHNIAETDV